MKSRTKILRPFVLLLCFFASALVAEEPWETVVIQGIRAMNRGDGQTFVQVAHPEFKVTMRDQLMQRMRGVMGSPQNQEVLDAFGLASVEELEKLAPDEMVTRMIRWMHFNSPARLRAAMKEARFKVVSSALEGNLQRVKVEMEFVLDGVPGKAPMVLLARQEGTDWKYDGDVASLRGPAK
ncbi:MAG: hypothetical protein V4599_10385 [Verrucomicrobiota bacterium]